MKKSFSTIGVCTLAVVCTGCSSWSKSTAKIKDSPWSISKMWKKEYQQPQSMAVIWASDVLSMPGRPATRGFGGRIYFYNEKSQAIPVDGELMVHGYLKHSQLDESEQIAADKTFGFTAEQLTSHFSPSDMGASYSIWIPWDAVDGMRAEITLIPTFKSKDGSIVQGSPAKVNLPGKTDLASDNNKKSFINTVSYSQSSTPTNPGPDVNAVQPTMRTTTINVPSNATIAKPRMVHAFTLGNSQPPPVMQSQFGEGVTLGGGSSSPLPSGGVGTRGASGATPAVGKQPLPQLAPPASGFPQIDLKQLTPPTMATASSFPKVSPLPPVSQPDWVKRSTPVQPASFSQ